MSKPVVLNMSKFTNQFIALKLLSGKESFMPDLKIPKPRKERRREITPRQMKEVSLRLDLLKELKKLRAGGYIKYWRIENGLSGYKGLPDFLIASKRKNRMVFVELKAFGGTVQKEQIEFANLCYQMGVNHLFAYTVERVLNEI